MRFALGGISCECNGFAAGETGTEYFRQTGFLLAGEEMLSLRNTSAEIGGAIDLLTKAAEKGSAAGKLQATVEIVPLLGARELGRPAEQCLLERAALWLAVSTWGRSTNRTGGRSFARYARKHVRRERPWRTSQPRPRRDARQRCEADCGG